MLTLIFSVNGTPVEVYECEATKLPYTDRDKENIAQIKNNIHRNFGYPPTVEVVD